ncbi:MAG: hypothetical protein E4H43_00295 [Bacteroidia bacterium]|nr:MAG: hypothetical protein E4H43_00295 [Bacteroidia bacterium]
MHKILILIMIPLLYSCIREINPVIIDIEETYLAGEGVFILNEGNFRSGNGSLSFFSYDSLKIFNHVFQDINNRPLGDVPYSMGIDAGMAYILFNNSDKIEVAERNDLKSVTTMKKIVSPRYISFTGGTKAYVTSLYSDSVTILDLLSNSVSGFINLKKSSEAIVALSTKAYVANWAGGNKIMVINTVTDQVTDSIEVGIEPESMVIDKSEMLWVLCNGGWKRENFAELIAINTGTNKIEKRFTFPSVTDSPTCLQINDTGETLYYLHNGVRRMDTGASNLPSGVFISEQNHVFYKLGVNPSNNQIFVTDALDYVQKGRVIR